MAIEGEASDSLTIVTSPLKTNTHYRRLGR